MTSSEPPTKMPKITSKAEEMLEILITEIKGSTSNLTPVVSEDYYNEIPLLNVFVAIIKNPKDISKTILMLNQKLPLNNLQHLKRVAKKEIILCPIEEINGDSIEKYIDNSFSVLKDVFERYKVVKVPSLPPKVKQQFEKCNKIWPCNFHPNKYNEKLVSGSFFNENELKIHRQFMEIACETAKYHLKLNITENCIPNIAVIVDPTIQSIVAISIDNRQKHPLQHAAMLAIDNVAKTQNGGAWGTNLQKTETIDTTMKGFDPDLCVFLKKKFTEVKFGAKQFKTKQKVGEDDEIGPYLCTGYDVYLLKEPCVMCSMGLVHARAKRVFFCMENSEFGGLKSKSKLQTIASLNHHFEVFMFDRFL